jgi:hypothetical protein
MCGLAGDNPWACARLKIGMNFLTSTFERSEVEGVELGIDDGVPMLVGGLILRCKTLARKSKIGFARSLALVSECTTDA